MTIFLSVVTIRKEGGVGFGGDELLVKGEYVLERGHGNKLAETEEVS